MANLSRDFCPYDSFDDFSSSLFQTRVSDPNPLAKEATPDPLSDAQITELLNQKTTASTLGSKVSGLDAKYRVDTIPPKDLRVWRAAMQDMWVDHASLYVEEWKAEMKTLREEIEETTNPGRLARLRRRLTTLETSDSRPKGFQRFLNRHQVTVDELKGHPMYATRGADEITLHPLALMVKRYQETTADEGDDEPSEESVIEESVDEPAVIEESGDENNLLDLEEPVSAILEAYQKLSPEDKMKNLDSVTFQEKLTPHVYEELMMELKRDVKEEEVPKSKSWFPSIW